jgi:hypothetical protein
MAQFENLGTLSGGDTRSTFTFSSIPSGFKDLWIVGSYVCTNTGLPLRVFINGDSTLGNYASIEARATSGVYTGQQDTGSCYGPYGNNANRYIGFWIKIAAYSTSQYHNVIGSWAAADSLRGDYLTQHMVATTVSSLSLVSAGGSDSYNYQITLFGMGE